MSAHDEGVRAVRTAASAIAGFVIVAVVTVIVIAGRAHTSYNRSVQANHAAQTAYTHASEAITELQAEANGECFRVDYLRWQIDRSAYYAYWRDLAAARLLAATHPPAHGARKTGRAFSTSASQIQFLPLTDCAQATRDPLGYKPPSGIPMERALREAAKVIRHPPQAPQSRARSRPVVQ